MVLLDNGALAAPGGVALEELTPLYARAMAEAEAGRGWTFLTNHAHVLLVVRRDSHARLREIAAAVGITERAVQLILGDLEGAGYVHRKRVGRRNEYRVLGGPLRHPLDQGRAVDDVLDALGDGIQT